MKRLLLSASVMAILSTQVFATRQIVDSEVDRVLSRQQIINRLFGSRDYTISISETDIARSALQRARRELHGNAESSDVVTEMTKEKIAQNLNDVKNDHVHIGGGYYSTSNFQNDDFCVESADNILVYPVQKERREAPNAFLPATYRSNRIGVDLYRRVVRYVEDMHLDRLDETRLIRHISPLSYILQQEIDLMMNGGVNRNGTMVRGIADRPRWVYDDGYGGMLNHVKSQINHHFDLIALANLRGLDRNAVAENLTQSLLDNGLSLLPGAAFRFRDRTYVLGTGHRGFLGIIHPDNGLLYPILADSRSKREQGEIFPVGDMNLPQGFQASSFLNKQWDRLDDFVHLTKMNKNDQRRAKILLEPAGYMAQSLIRDMQPDFSRTSLSELMNFALLSFSEQQQRNFFNRLEPFLFANENISRYLDNRLRNQIVTHAAMTEDLWPSRFSNRDRQADFTLQAVNYLLYQELKEKLTSAWPQRSSMFLAQEGERDNALLLTQERLRTKERDFTRVQTSLEESNREGQEKTRLIREKENELRLARENAEQEIRELRKSHDEALTHQRNKERNLQKERDDANREISLAQEDVAKARANLLKAEQDLDKEKQSNKSILDNLHQELNVTKDRLRFVEKDSQTRIKKAETLIKLANIVVLKTGKDLIEKEQTINQLSEEKEKVERENQGLLTTIEQNTQAMSLMRQDFDEFKNKFINKQNEVIGLNHQVISLNEDMRRLQKHLSDSQEGLKNWHQQTIHLQQKVENLSADLKKYKDRVKELKSSLKVERKVSRLAQEELQKKYEGLLPNAKGEEIDQLKLQHEEEVKELSKKFVALTEELEIVQRKRDEVEVLYEEAGKREKEALLKLNKLQAKVNEEFLNLSAISPNNSPLGKNLISGNHQINLGSLNEAHFLYDIDEESEAKALNSSVSQKSDHTTTTIKRLNTGERLIGDVEDHTGVFLESHDPSFYELQQPRPYMWNRGNGQNIKFISRPALGDGNCGYTALGIDRSQATELLLSNVSQENIRRLVAPEIRGAVLRDELPENMKGGNVYADIPQLLEKLNHQVGEYNRAHGLEGNDSLSASQLIQGLRNMSLSQEAESLQNLVAVARDLDRQLVDWSESEEAYRAYIEGYVGDHSRNNWLVFEPNSTSTLDALAVLQNWNVRVLQPVPGNLSTLSERHSANPGGGRTVHILYNGINHFDGLDINESGEPDYSISAESNISLLKKESQQNPKGEAENNSKLKESAHEMIKSKPSQASEMIKSSVIKEEKKRGQSASQKPKILKDKKAKDLKGKKPSSTSSQNSDKGKKKRVNSEAPLNRVKSNDSLGVKAHDWNREKLSLEQTKFVQAQKWQMGKFTTEQQKALTDIWMKEQKKRQ